MGKEERKNNRFGRNRNEKKKKKRRRKKKKKKRKKRKKKKKKKSIEHPRTSEDLSRLAEARARAPDRLQVSVLVAYLIILVVDARKVQAFEAGPARMRIRNAIQNKRTYKPNQNECVPGGEQSSLRG
jgi:hypothetical protein